MIVRPLHQGGKKERKKELSAVTSIVCLYPCISYLISVFQLTLHDAKYPFRHQIVCDLRWKLAR